jgi:hypothetical protein
MNNIAIERLRAAYALRPGVLSGSPLLEAARAWGPDGSVDALREWVAAPATRRVAGILRELSFNPPARFAGQSVEQDHGFTSAMQLAARILDDPTVLFPEAFDTAVETALPAPDYEQGV